jgi:hypothetical protein
MAFTAGGDPAGHEALDVERVVRERGDYVVVEKNAV